MLLLSPIATPRTRTQRYQHSLSDHPNAAVMRKREPDLTPSASSGSNNIVIRAHLPDQQRTVVNSLAGMTVGEALKKALESRYFLPEMCCVYKYSPETNTKQPIDWDLNVSMLRGDDVLVEAKDKVPTTTQLSHKFTKFFFGLSKCHFCNELLIKGVRCVICGIEFHRNQSCSKSIPPLCKPAMDYRNLSKHMLARASGPPISITTPELPPNQSHHFHNHSHHHHLQQYISSPNYHHQHHHLHHHNQHHLLHHHNNNDQTSHHHLSQSHATTSSSSSFSQQAHNNSSIQKQQQDTVLEEEWEIKPSDITSEGVCIGRGSFGTVYKGYCHGPVALKVLNVKNPTAVQLEAFQNEVVVLKATRHRNVMLFRGYTLEPTLTIVTQWCEGRSLYKHLHVDEIPPFNNKQIIDIAQGVAQGMEYLHGHKNIIHRDLKSSNVFLLDDLTVKIGDFGLATVKTRWEGSTQTHHPTGSIQWMAPEVIRAQPGVNPFTFKADVYSYGNLIYELLTRKLPYFDFEGGKEVLLYLIGKGSIELNTDVIEADKPKELKDLMFHCTQRNPEDRPTFVKILEVVKNIKPRLLRSISEPLRLNNLEE